MVNENFKLGIELEVEQKSLDDVTKQVKKAIEVAFKKGAAGAKGGAAAGTTTATARSAANAAKADSYDIFRPIIEG